MASTIPFLSNHYYGPFRHPQTVFSIILQRHHTNDGFFVDAFHDWTCLSAVYALPLSFPFILYQQKWKL